MWLTKRKFRVFYCLLCIILLSCAISTKAISNANNKEEENEIIVGKKKTVYDDEVIIQAKSRNVRGKRKTEEKDVLTAIIRKKSSKSEKYDNDDDDNRGNDRRKDDDDYRDRDERDDDDDDDDDSSYDDDDNRQISYTGPTNNYDNGNIGSERNDDVIGQSTNLSSILSNEVILLFGIGLLNIMSLMVLGVPMFGSPLIPAGQHSPSAPTPINFPPFNNNPTFINYPSSNNNPPPTPYVPPSPIYTPPNPPSSIYTPPNPPSSTYNPPSPPSPTVYNPPSPPTRTSHPTWGTPNNYWNYDVDSENGPLYWDRLQDIHVYDRIFEPYVDTTENQCGSTKRQSPIVLQTGGQIQCTDDHDHVTQRGSHDFDENEFLVLPHALRVKFPLDRGSGERAPRVDFSNLSDFIPAVFMDVKILSEHNMVNQNNNIVSYPGEIQIAHHFSEEDKIVMISFFFDHRNNIFNERFEDFIRMWEDVYGRRNHYCEYRDFDGEPPDYDEKFRERSKNEMIRLWGDPDIDGVPGSSDYDLYRLMPTAYY